MARIDLLAYPIVVESGLLARLSELLREHAPAHRYVIVTDENVARHCLTTVGDAAREATSPDRVHHVVIPPGERQKTREQWAAITDAMLAAGCARDTVVLALGGGVIGDLAGFVAATYMRGVPVVQLPTTLLAMVDASVGGKTAVDTPAGKNTVGAFHPPAVVAIDPSTLTSLPERELRAGMAEMIKHAVIADSHELERILDLLPGLIVRDSSPESLEAVVARSVRIKAAIVASDERETGRRKVLNFGHTVGHGVEAASGYAMLHGEAIAVGMVAEAQLAERVGIAVTGTAQAVERVVTRAGLPARLPAGVAPDRVLALMSADKKRRLGSLEYALPLRLGTMAGSDTGWAVPIPAAEVRRVLESLT